MSEPNDLATLADILRIDDQFFAYQKWHQFRVASPNGGNAGRWAREHLKGQWNFKPDFGSVLFYIEDARDAMFFKLTWHK